MKKFLFIAAAAVVAMAACSKVDAVDNAPAKKISFEVASYVPQTKANGSLANSEDQIFDFHTYAYQFPALGTPVVFMSETVYAWTSATHSAANKVDDIADNIVEWAPEDDYFWPKTGTINFYSYAGTHTPDEGTAAAAAAANTDLKTVNLTFTDATIAADSNILVADPAMGMTRSNYDTATYPVDNAGEAPADNSDPDNPVAATHVTKGVPTLFHHMLTKIQFDVKLKTANTNSNVWKVEVLDEFDANNKSQLIAKNQGTLALTSVEGTNNGAWSPSIATPASASSEAVLWVPTTNGTTEEITLESEEMTLDANEETSGDAVQLLALRSVMPQLSNGVELSLVYTVKAYHVVNNNVEANPYLSEVRTVGIDDTKYLSNLVNSSVINWLPNKKITYHIVIDPVTEKVTFDPAVEDYDPVTGNGNYDIDINEGGIVTPPAPQNP